MARTQKALAGPAYIAAAAANIYNPAAGVKATIRQIKVVNKTGGAITFTLYKGATGGSAGGTEVSPLSYSVPANDFRDLYFVGLHMTATDFLTGVASAANSLVILVMGEDETA